MITYEESVMKQKKWRCLIPWGGLAEKPFLQRQRFLHFPRAGMDGYAVRAVETRGATAEKPQKLFKVVGSLVAEFMFYCNQTIAVRLK